MQSLLQREQNIGNGSAIRKNQQQQLASQQASNHIFARLVAI